MLATKTILYVSIHLFIILYFYIYSISLRFCVLLSNHNLLDNSIRWVAEGAWHVLRIQFVSWISDKTEENNWLVYTFWGFASIYFVWSFYSALANYTFILKNSFEHSFLFLEQQFNFSTFSSVFLIITTIIPFSVMSHRCRYPRAAGCFDPICSFDSLQSLCQTLWAIRYHYYYNIRFLVFCVRRKSLYSLHSSHLFVKCKTINPNSERVDDLL